MRWLRNLLTDPEKRKIYCELEELRIRVDELSAQNALLVRLNECYKRFEELDLEVKSNLVTFDQRLNGFDQRIPQKKVDDSWKWFKPLENQVTAEGVKWTFGAAILLMIVIVLFFVVDKKSKEAIDAAAYLFPCCAAIAAGLTVYEERRKGLLFISSLFLLFLGIDMFLAGMANGIEPSVEPLAYTTLFTVGLVDLGLFFMMIYAVRKAALSTNDKKDKYKRVGMELRAYGITLIVTVGLTIYAALFLVKNYPCYHQGANMAECKGVWRWPLPTEH